MLMKVKVLQINNVAELAPAADLTLAIGLLNYCKYLKKKVCSFILF